MVTRRRICGSRSLPSLAKLRFSIDSTHMVTDQTGEDEEFQNLLQKHSKLFSSEPGCLSGTQIKLATY